MTKNVQYWNILTSEVITLIYIENTVSQTDKLDSYIKMAEYGRNMQQFLMVNF
jgi:hypothetical protein